MVAVPALTNAPPSTVIVLDEPTCQVDPLAAVRAGAVERGPVVVSVPVTFRAPLPVTVPEITRGTARLWMVLTPRVP